MATVKGANRTIMDSITPSTVLDPGLAGGIVRCMVDTYTADATEGAGTVIEMGGDLPKGARILDIIVTNPDGSATMKVGDVADDDRYEASVAAGATEHLSVAGGLGYEILTLPSDTTPTNQILITTIGDTLDTGLVTRCVILYTIE